jgi:hypothetical protein
MDFVYVNCLVLQLLFFSLGHSLNIIYVHLLDSIYLDWITKKNDIKKNLIYMLILKNLQ